MSVWQYFCMRERSLSENSKRGPKQGLQSCLVISRPQFAPPGEFQGNAWPIRWGQLQQRRRNISTYLTVVIPRLTVLLGWKAHSALLKIQFDLWLELYQYSRPENNDGWRVFQFSEITELTNCHSWHCYSLPILRLSIFKNNENDLT